MNNKNIIKRGPQKFKKRARPGVDVTYSYNEQGGALWYPHTVWTISLPLIKETVLDFFFFLYVISQHWLFYTSNDSS